MAQRDVTVMTMDAETAQWIALTVGQVGLLGVAFSLLVTSMSLCRTMSALASRIKIVETRLVSLEIELGPRSDGEEEFEKFARGELDKFVSSSPVVVRSLSEHEQLDDTEKHNQRADCIKDVTS
jgi:hypothetical protein